MSKHPFSQHDLEMIARLTAPSPKQVAQYVRFGGIQSGKQFERHATFVEAWLLDRGLNPRECSEADFQAAMKAASEQPPL